MKNLLARWSLVPGPVLLLLAVGCSSGGTENGEDVTVDIGGDAVLCQEDADCDDDNPCTADVCLEGVCQWTPVDNTCDDGDPCTEDDMCSDGECAGAAKVCDDGEYCNGLEACNPETGACEDGAAPEINDGVECTLDECDEDDDKVVHVPNDAICDDGNTCTANVCNETLGCQDTVLDGETCEDGSLCTVDDVCDADVCVGVSVECDDGEFCNGLETCDLDTGDCVDGDPPELDDGVECTLDECEEDNVAVSHTPDDGLCDDENSCTVDTCDIEQGCIYDTLDDGESCDDGNLCTDDDVCGGGVCLPGAFICVEDCDNEMDDDQDDLVDCDDADDCALDMACQPDGDLCGEAFDLTLGIPLTAADAGAVIQFFGTTVGKTNVFSGSCDEDTAAAADTVHKIELAEALGLQISADFDSGAWAALYVLNDACTEDLACASMDSSDATTLTVVLQPGMYFITVDGAYPGDIGAYDLEVEVFVPSDTEDDCGDGVDNDADGMTDCDDDECTDAEICNILTGETCEDALLLTDEPLTLDAVGTEIVFTGTTAGMTDDLAGTCIAELESTPDLIYTFELADPLVVDASFDFSGNKWPALVLFGGDCLAESELICVTAKSDAATFGKALPAGTYYMVLDASYNNDAGPYTLIVAFDAVPEAEVDCGDGLDDDLNGFIDCDDEACGEDPLCVGFDGDNCEKPFLVNDGLPVTADLYGGTLNYTGTTDGLQDFYGACSVAAEGSPDAVYVMEVADPVVVHATHDFEGSFWPALYAMNAECDSVALLGCDAATSGAAELDLALAAGVYYFVIDASYVGDAGPYTFELTFAAPPENEAVCFDGADNDVDGFTDCDDEDCAADLYCLDPYEPNDTQETAYDLGDLSNDGFDTDEGTVSPAAEDVDHFVFTIQGDHALALTLTPIDGLDGKVTILDGDGMTLLSADAGGVDAVETIETELAGPGTYYIWVTGYGATEGSYALTVVLTALTEYDCGNGADEDADDLVDCCDDDCAALPECGFEDVCFDGEDNDCDSLVDCDDDDCTGTSACGAGDTCDDVLLVNDGVAIDASYDGMTLEYWGSTIGYGDDFSGSCDEDTTGSADAVWELTVAETVAVNAGMDYQSYMWPAVYITTSPCGEGDEIVCGAAGGDFAWTGDTVLDAGTYYIVLDGSWAGDEEVYQLQIDVTAVLEAEIDCGDGVDEDFDGFTDCCDDECAADPGCLAETVCGDGLDNDCDDATDCSDDDCTADPACAGATCAAPFTLNDGAAVVEGDLPAQFVENGDTDAASADLTGSCDTDTEGSNDLVYELVLETAVSATISHDFESYNYPAVYVFSGECIADNELACATAGMDAALIEDLALEPGTYYVVVDASWSGDAGPYTLTIDLTGPIVVEDDCGDGVDNDADGFADCDDDDCGPEICDPEPLPWEETFSYGPDDVVKGGIWGSDTDCDWEISGGFAEFDYMVGCSETEPYWLVGAILDVQACGEISVTFDEAADYATWAYSHKLAVFDGFTAAAEIELALDALTSDWAPSGPYTFDVSALDFVRVGAGYLGDDADTWRVDNVYVECTVLAEICDDGVDNDGDQTADCEDYDCKDFPGCQGETCDVAIPITEAPVVLADAGLLVVMTGDTTGHSYEYEGSCDSDSANAADIAYRFELTDPMYVTVSHDFDGTWMYSAAYLFSGTCGPDFELACHAGDSGASTFGLALDPGVYYVIVDASYSGDEGPYTLTVGFETGPPAGSSCDSPIALADAPIGVADDGLEVVATGDTSDWENTYYGTCSGGSESAKDVVYSFELTETMQVTGSHDFDGTYNYSAVYVFDGACEEASELTCASGGGGAAEFDLTIDAGVYYIVVDADYSSDAGAYTLTVTFSEPAPAGAPELYFLEYIEGGSNNKAVEIINAGDGDADLQECVINRYSNGAVDGEEVAVFISADEETILAPGGLWVVCHSSIVDATDCDYLTSGLSHNGNDALALVCGETTWDVFGRIGEDPGSYWANGDESVKTQDMTLRRKCTVTAGDTDGSDEFDPGVEWDAFAQDTLDDLGINHCL